MNYRFTLWTLYARDLYTAQMLPGLMVLFNGKAICANKTTITHGLRVRRNGFAHNN